MYYVYMLRCKDNSVYTGITTDIERRMREHFFKTEKCAKYTFSHEAQKLEQVWTCSTRTLASKLEYHIKTLSKAKKEELISSACLKNVFNENIDYEKYSKYEK